EQRVADRARLELLEMREGGVRRARARTDVLQEEGAGVRPVAAPQLEPVRAVVRQEEEEPARGGALERRARARLEACHLAGGDVLDEPRPRLAPVGRPELGTVDGVGRREVGAVPDA